jgi:hypothetical protein
VRGNSGAPLLRSPGQVIECAHSLYGKPVLLTELGYSKNKTNGVEGAYRFWTGWAKRFGREDWFDGIWWWNAPTQTDAFSLLGNDAGVQVCLYNDISADQCRNSIGSARAARG